MGIKKKLKKVVKGAAKVAKKVAPIAGSAIGYYYGGPAGASLGGSIGGAIKGGAKGAAKGAALGGLGGLAYQGITGVPAATPGNIPVWRTPPFVPEGGRPYFDGTRLVTPDAGNVGYDDAWPMPDSGGGGGNVGYDDQWPVPSYGGLPMPPPNINAPNIGNPPTFDAGFNWKDAALATSSSGNLAKILRDIGINVDPRTLGMLGTGLSTGLGVYGANQQDKALQGVINNQRAVTQPFLDDVMDIFKNPDKFYQRPEVTGAIDASMRGLSAKVGNPINNPGAIAQQAAYNTGLYNNALNTRLATALGGQDTLNRLQTQQALNKGNALNAVGSGLGSMLSTAPNYGELLGQYLFSNRTA